MICIKKDLLDNLRFIDSYEDEMYTYEVLSKARNIAEEYNLQKITNGTINKQLLKEFYEIIVEVQLVLARYGITHYLHYL